MGRDVSGQTALAALATSAVTVTVDVVEGGFVGGLGPERGGAGRT